MFLADVHSMRPGLRNNIIAIVSLMLCIASAACGSGLKRTRETGVYHTVQPGQTLYRIALTYGVPLDEISASNKLDDPSLIIVGQRLFIPGAAGELEVPVLKPGPAAFTFLPVEGTVTSPYGRRGRSFHYGIDISAAGGSPVRCVLPGAVTFSGREGDYGNLVIVDHGKGLETFYGHNARNLVVAGQRVRAGDRIATVGRSGNATGHHLHFEIRIDGKPVNPLQFLQR